MGRFAVTLSLEYTAAFLYSNWLYVVSHSNNKNNNSKIRKKTIMWGMKTTTVPVVIGALGFVKVHLTPNTISAKMQTLSCSKSDLTFFCNI